MNIASLIRDKLIHQSINKDKAVLVKLTASVVLPCVFFVVVISVILAVVYNNKIEDDIHSISYQSLENIRTSVSNLVDDSRTTAYEIGQNNNIKTLFYSQNITNAMKLDAITYLKNVIVVNHQLYSAYLITNDNIIIKIGGAAHFEENYDQLKALIDQQQSVLYSLPRKISTKSGDISFLTTIYKEEYITKNKKAYVIVNFIPTEFLNKDALLENQDFAACTTEGDVIYHTNMDNYGSNIKAEGFFDDILKSPDAHGTKYFEVNEEKYAINYLKDSGNTFFVYSTIPEDRLYNKTIAIRNNVLLICAASMALIFAITWYFSYKLYNPISYMFFNIRKFMSENNSNVKLSDDIMLLSNSFTKIVETLNNNETKDMISSYQINFFNMVLNSQQILSQSDFNKLIEDADFKAQTNQYFKMVVYKMCRHQEFLENNSDEAIVFQLNTIKTIILQTVSDKVKCTVFGKNTDELILFLCSTEKILDSIYENLHHIKECIFMMTKLKFSIACSDNFKMISANFIRTVYMDTRDLIKYRVFYDEDYIFKGKFNFNDSLNTDKISSLKKSIPNSVKKNQRDEYLIQIKLLYAELKNHNFEYFLSVTIDISIRIKNICEFIAPSQQPIQQNANLFSKEIESFENYDDMEKWFLELYYEVTEYMSICKQKQTSDLCYSAINYIEHNYMLTDISASMMAEKLSITPQHFSRIFHKFTSMSFPDYINNLRLEIAKEMMDRDDNTNIKEIAELVGFNNSSYFSMMFKKKYGLPPSKYILNQIDD